MQSQQGPERGEKLFEEQQSSVSRPPAAASTVSFGASSARLLRNAALNAAATAAAHAARPLSRGRAGRGPSAQPSGRRIKRAIHDHLSLGLLKGSLTEEELAERLQHLYIQVEHKASFLEPLAKPDNKELLRDFRRGLVGTAAAATPRGRRGFRGGTGSEGSSSSGGGLSAREILADSYARVDRRFRPLLLDRARETLKALGAKNSIYSEEEANTPLLTDLEALLQRFGDRKGLIEEDVGALNARIREAAGLTTGARRPPPSSSAPHSYGEELLRILKAPLTLSSSSEKGKAYLTLRLSSSYSRMLVQGLAAFAGLHATPLEKEEEDSEGDPFASFGDYSLLRVSAPLLPAPLPPSFCNCAAAAGDFASLEEGAAAGAMAAHHPLRSLTSLRCKLGALQGAFDHDSVVGGGAGGAGGRPHSRSPSPALFAASALPVIQSRSKASDLDSKVADAQANSPFFEAVRASRSASRSASASLTRLSISAPSSAAVPAPRPATGAASLPLPPPLSAAGGGAALPASTMPLQPCSCIAPLCPLFLLFVKSLSE